MAKRSEAQLNAASVADLNTWATLLGYTPEKADLIRYILENQGGAPVFRLMKFVLISPDPNTGISRSDVSGCSASDMIDTIYDYINLERGEGDDHQLITNFISTSTFGQSINFDIRPQNGDAHFVEDGQYILKRTN